MNSGLEKLKFKVHKFVKFLIDYIVNINLANNPMFHGISKHIETIFHFPKNQVNNWILPILYHPTEQQVVNVLTKPMNNNMFAVMREQFGVLACWELELIGCTKVK